MLQRRLGVLATILAMALLVLTGSVQARAAERNAQAAATAPALARGDDPADTPARREDPLANDSQVAPPEHTTTRTSH